MKINPVILIRASDNGFLDVLRSLGESGIPVISIVYTWQGAGEWLSEKSKFFHESYTIINPAENEALAKEQLITLGKQFHDKYKEKCLIMATSDTVLFFLQKYFDEFSPYFLQMGHKDFNEPILYELNKANFFEIMKQNNLPIPLTFSVSKKTDIEIAVKNITYPCLYKPTLKDLKNSFQSSHNGYKAVECNNPEELRTSLINELENGYELVVQEKLEFDGLENERSCYVYCDGQGNLRAINGMHRIFEYPKPYGTGIVCKASYTNEFYEIAQGVCKALNWQGFLGLELIYDKHKKKWLIIEANLRAWLTSHFQTALGLNFSKLLYDDLMNTLPKHIETKYSNNNDLYQINLFGFINYSLTLHSNEQEALNYVSTFIHENIGKIIFAYYNENDKNPGYVEKEILEKKYPNCKDIIAKIYSCIEENDIILSKSKQ